jgi:hypothetical protein
MNKCYFCNGKHSCRNCPVEQMVAPYMKKIVGIHMESFVANKLCCPRCNKQSLRLLGNHTPSLDIVCDNCYTNFEVKSKCLSIPILPKDLMLNHGNYFDYINRQREGLDFIIIIYKVDRKTKMIEIRNILHVANDTICTNNNNNFIVEKNSNNSMSKIFITDYTKLNQIKLHSIYNYNFSTNIDCILQSKQNTLQNYICVN